MNDPEWPSVIDRNYYIRQLHEIKESGYATSFEEREPGAAAISVPIFSRNGSISAALSVSGPVNRLSIETLNQYAPLLVEAAHDMGLMIS
ncbi:Transcriptional regulator KdgR [compost metagenome]